MDPVLQKKGSWKTESGHFHGLKLLIIWFKQNQTRAFSCGLSKFVFYKTDVILPVFSQPILTAKSAALS